MQIGDDRMRFVGKNAFTRLQMFRPEPVSGGRSRDFHSTFNRLLLAATGRVTLSITVLMRQNVGAEFDVAAQNHATTGGSNAY